MGCGVDRKEKEDSIAMHVNWIKGQLNHVGVLKEKQAFVLGLLKRALKFLT